MRITFTQSGGFSGVVRGCRIDTAALPAADRESLESLVAASGLTASFSRFGAAARDRKEFVIRIEWSDRSIEVACDDASLPGGARPLVGCLAARSRPRPPGWADESTTAELRAPDDGVAHATTAPGWGRFDGEVVARWHDDGREMTLVAPFAYVDPRGGRWEAAAGLVVNGATIPRPFWSLIGGPFEGRFRNASVVHDAACVARTHDWQATHRMFHEACRCGGVEAVLARTMFYAVWHFGPRWRVEERSSVIAGRPVVERRLSDEPMPTPTPADVESVAAYFATHDVPDDAVPTLEIPGVRHGPR